MKYLAFLIITFTLGLNSLAHVISVSQTTGSKTTSIQNGINQANTGDTHE
jgi:hypothetical protein